MQKCTVIHFDNIFFDSKNFPVNYRLSKELVMYEKEVTDGEEKLVKMKESNQDEYDIKKYVSSDV